MNLFQLATRGVDLSKLPDEEAPRQSVAFEPSTSGGKFSVPSDLNDAFEFAAKDFGIDPDVLRAVAYAESRFHPDVVSGKVKSKTGATGLMQFMPATAKEYGIDPLDPVQSIFGAAAYLRKSLDKFDGDYGKAVASYNAGPNRKDFDSEDWDARMPAETQGYLRTVFTAADQLKSGKAERPLPAGVEPSKAGAGRGVVNPTRSAPVPDTGDETARLAARYKAPDAPQQGGFIQSVGDFFKPAPTSVLESYKPTATEQQAANAQRLRYGAGPIKGDVLVAANEVASGTANSSSPTVNTVAKQMQERGDTFTGYAQAKNTPILKEGARDAKAAEFRSAGEWAIDTASGIAQGTVTAAGMLPNVLAPSSELARSLKGVQQAWAEQESDVLKAQRAQLKAKVDSEEGFAGKYAATVYELVTNPALGLSEAAKQVPNFLAVMAASRLGAAATGAGFMAAEKASPILALSNAIGGGAMKAGAQAAGATTGGLAASVVMTSGDAAGNVYDTLTDPVKTPKAVWEQNEDYQALIAQGVSHKEAVKQIASAKAQFAAMVVAPLGAFGFMGADAALATRGIAGLVRSYGPKAGAKTSAKEIGGENVEEMGTQYGGNVVARTVNPNIKLDEGVAEAGATATITSAPFAGYAAYGEARGGKGTKDAQDPRGQLIAAGLLDPQTYNPSTIGADGTANPLLERMPRKPAPTVESQPTTPTVPPVAPTAPGADATQAVDNIAALLKQTEANIDGTATQATPVQPGSQAADVGAAQVDAAQQSATEGQTGTGAVDVAGQSESAQPLTQPVDGFVRLYHGGSVDGETARWVTPDLKYAQGYANKSRGAVFYVDVPANSPYLTKAFDDTGTSVKAQINAFNAPPEIASQLKPMPQQAGATGIAAEMAAMKERNQPAASQQAQPQIFTGKSALFDGYGASVGSVEAGDRKQLMVDPNGGYFWGDWKQESQRDVGAVAGGADKDATPASFTSSKEARQAAASTPLQAAQTTPSQPAQQQQAKPRAKPQPLLNDTEAAMLADFERMYQADVKGEIKTRLGLLPARQDEAAAPAEKRKPSELLAAIKRAGGIKSTNAGDLMGGSAMDANRILPGLFTNGGMNMDLLVPFLKERGYLTQADEDSIKDNGGVNKLAEILQAELSGARAQTMDSTAGFESDAEAAMRSELDSKAFALGLPMKVTNEMSTERLNGVINRIERKLGKPVNTDFATRKMSRTEAMAERQAILMTDRVERARAQYDADIQAFAEANDRVQERVLDVMTDEDGNIEVIYESTAGEAYDEGRDTREDSGEVGRPVAQGARTGAGNPEADRTEAGAGQEGLTSYTPEEVTARQQATAQAEAATKRAEEAAARAEAAAKQASEIAQRSVAAADTFELGGNAEDNLSGQQGLRFSRASENRAARAALARIMEKGVTSPDDLRDLLRVPGYSKWAKSTIAGDVAGAAALRDRLTKEYPGTDWQAPKLNNQGIITLYADWADLTSDSIADLARIADEFDAPIAVRNGAVNNYYESKILRANGFEGYMGAQERMGRPSAVMFSHIRPAGGITATTPLFSQSQQSPRTPAAATNGITTEAAQKIVDGITAQWKNAPEVVVLADLQDVKAPKAVRDYDAQQRSQGAEGEPEGFWYKGKAYVVAGALNKPDDVARVLMHEALGHYGLRGVFGDDLKPILRQVAMMRQKDVAAKAEQYGLDVTDEAGRLHAAEEVLAEMAQSNPDAGVVKRAIAAIRAWMRKHIPGFRNMALTDADIISNYLLPARNFVVNGGRDGGQGGGVRFQRAWHGTPHRGIEKFSTDKIGTGEGAQAYGYGLYFASKRDIAEWYRKKLSPKPKAITFDGVKLKANSFPYIGPQERRYTGLTKKQVSVFESLSDIQIDVLRDVASNGISHMRDVYAGHVYPISADQNREKTLIELADRIIEGKSGQLYEVEIPNDSDMLLWDKPLSQQTEAVQNALDSAIRAPYATGKSLSAAEIQRIESQWSMLTGEKLYKMLEDANLAGGSGAGTASARAASMHLAAFGLKGIKYLDGTSRNAGEGSFNYVVFSGDDVEIKAAMFSRGAGSKQAQQNLALNDPSPAWMLPASTKTDALVYELQDQKVDLKRTQEAIKAAGRTITEPFDARMAETLMPGRVAYRTETFLKTEVAPLMEAMAKNNVTQNELSDYLLARHAPERNAQIAKVNPEMPDGGAGTNSQGVLMTTQAAQDHIAALTTGKRMVLQLLANKIDAITASTRDLLVREGLEKQSTMDAWTGAYKHYVPLFKDEAVESPAHPIGSGMSVTGRASKRAMGSEGEVTNMVAHILMQREAAITRAEKNRVAMSLYGLALSNPNKDVWSTIRPSMRADKIGAELAAMGVDPVEAEQGMQGVPTIRTINAVTGLVQETPNPMYKRLDNALVVKVDGEDRVILFNAKNTDAMNMARALKNQDGLTNFDLAGSMVGTATRYLASINTQYNPAFGMVNVVRDIGGALVNLTTTGIADQKAKVLGDIPAAMKGIARDVRGDQARTPWSDLWVQFQEDGGRTGYRDLFIDPFKRAEAVQKDLDALQRDSKASAGKAAHLILDLLDDFNTTLENGVRLSAYKAALDKGMSRPAAAKMARELTVDFNRKGRMGREIGPLYAFFNASVQGTARTIESLKGPAGKKIIAGGLMLGVIQSLMLAAAGFDDDEPPEFVKARAFIIPMGDKRYIAIPLQFGLNALPNTGRVITDLLLTGGKDAGKKTFNAIGEIMGSFNPLGGGNIFTAHGLLTTVAPTVADPLVDLATNTNFAGTPIGKDRADWDTRPGAKLARESTQRSLTGQAYIGISKAINAASGGNEFKKGLASPTPEQVQYVFTTAGGGLYRELEKTLNIAGLKADGFEIKARMIPLGGRFAGEIDDQDTQRSRYYRNSERLAALEAELKGFEKDDNEAAVRRIETERSDEVDLLGDYKHIRQAITKLNKLAADNINDMEMLKELDAERLELMRELNDSVRKLEKRSELFKRD